MELHLPWIELAILTPLLGAMRGIWLRDPERSRRNAVVFSALALAASVGAWIDFATIGKFSAHDGMDVLAWAFGYDPFVIDELSAPLLPLAALLNFLTAVSTLRTKMRRFSFAGMLFSESLLLATLSLAAGERWALVVLLAFGTVQPLFELRARKRPMRVYILHMGLFVVLLVAGQALADFGSGPSAARLAPILLMAAMLVRNGTFPAHCWMTDLFEHATFGTSLLFVAPRVAAFAVIRLVLPIAPDWMLHGISLASLATAVYAAGMAIVQREARRFFCYLFLSHASLVLVGLEMGTPIGLTGALCVWLSVGMSLAGLGLTLRSLEARAGRLSLIDYHGLGEHMPALAALFLITGLASVGFPGSFGFVGMELLIDSGTQANPLVGAAIVLAAALSGIAVLQAYFRLFGGARHMATFSLGPRWPERLAVLTLAALIFGGGLWPQPGVSSRYHAAYEIIENRQANLRSSDEGVVATLDTRRRHGP